MIYQIGFAGVLRFKRMLAAMLMQNWEQASIEILDSRWAHQTPQRAKRHALQMKTGQWIGP